MASHVKMIRVFKVQDNGSNQAPQSDAPRRWA